MDRNGSEILDFNYNVHNCLVENNQFINSDGYSISEEVIDMVGGDGYYTDNNIIRGNKIIGNFQTAVRPSLSARNNIIENNYIEWRPGKTANEALIYLYGKNSDFSTPQGNLIKNNILVGGKSGVTLSCAKSNTISGNSINGGMNGITLTNNSIYGADLPAFENKVSDNNIHDVNCGILVQGSPNNTISGNTIINFKKADICRV